MKNLLYSLLVLLAFTGCDKHHLSISSFADSPTGRHASAELVKYLSAIYPGVDFRLFENARDAGVQLILSSDLENNGIILDDPPIQDESFKIVPLEDKLLIVAADDRGLLNAVYALLEKLGCGFYISGDKLPEPKKWKGYDDWGMEDRPVVGDRFLFNWHNFISGCTGWNAVDWKLWIDQASKMRYNGIMVHAYGNNPMFSYDYLGETKTTGYLNNSANGRDWGNQHINDVRRMVGGELFDEPVYGAEPSFAREENKVEEVTEMMQEVYEYAEQSGTRVIFALDFDTWMSHPQNIVKKLPREAVFELYGRLTPNPEHPEGYKYYRHQVQELLAKYPQIDELTVWSRSPQNKVNLRLGTIWMAFPYEKFPAEWKDEYRRKLKQHPHLEDDLRAQGMFAFGKVVTAIRKAAAEIKPELEIGYGSWTFNWLDIADALLPGGIVFRPLDARIVFDSEESLEELSEVTGNRKIYPIVWAHHDDFSYIGAPYQPYPNLTDMLTQRGVGGLGIIHWTTHPLDLYFTGTSRQLWEASANEPIEESVRSFVIASFGESDKELLNYYTQWITEGPMFGRETSDHFIDLGKRHWKADTRPWDTLIRDAYRRLDMLDAVPKELHNDYWKYQRGMEEFYISFFNDHSAFDKAYKLVDDGDIAPARELMQGTDPDLTIKKYVEAIQHIRYTSGEKALVLSLNTRWMTDYSNLKQRVGLEPVRIRFSPTQHDPLAQIPGINTYHIDKNGNWWTCFWEHELPGHSFNRMNGQSAMVASGEFEYPLGTMHGQKLPPGEFSLAIEADIDDDAILMIRENGMELASLRVKAGETVEPLRFAGQGGDLVLTVQTDGIINIEGLMIIPAGLQEN